MAEEYSRELLRRAVAQVCQLLGWHAMHSSPLAVLTHVLEKYLVALAESAHRYAEHDCRTEPTLDDLACAFRDLNVRLPELKAYAKAVPPAPLPHPVPAYPLERAPSLNFLKPGSREVLTRPPHVHDHLPPMWPERENEGDVDVESTNAATPLAPPPDPFKRPGEPASNSIKRPKLKHPDDECHARELSSVMMTVSGFLSPAREGKLPEARTPIVVPDVPPDVKPKPLQFNPFTGRPPPVLNDRPDKKIKKSKAVNGKVDKNKKKEKPPKNVDRPYVPNENRSNKHASHAAKIKPPSKNHTNDVHLSNRPPFFPENSIKTVKQEAIERPVKVFPPPVEHRPHRPPVQVPLPPPPTIVNPHKFNASKPASIVDDHAKPTTVPFPVTIKEEKMDTEKLTSQPDRSKMSIFKKISTKIKEEKIEKPYEPPIDRTFHENVTIKIEKTSPPRSSPHEMDDYPPKLKPLNLEMRTSTSYSPSVVDLSSKRNNSDIINVDDVFDIKQKIKQEPIDDYPTDLTRPKISVMSHEALVGNSVVKEKKDKKRKERKIKTEKVPKEHTKVKKQHPIDKIKPSNEFGEPSGAVNFPDNMLSFLSTQPGLIPNRNHLFGLMNPGLIPRGNLFTQMPNPALRGLLPHDAANMLPNPFSMKDGTNNLLPTTPGFTPGLIPHGLTNPMFNHGFGQPPRMPQPPNLPSFLRRPSLEVIPIDGDEDVKVKPKSHFVSPNLVIKEKDKQKNIKVPINNSFISNSVSITNSTKHSPPKPSPVINVPNIKPDVTIQLNSPPTEKIKTVDLSKLVDNSSFPVVKEKDKSEKKKDKSEKKKDKKDKEQRIKKKKDKKEKLRLKKEKERDREENKEVKEKPKKDKKEKKRDKEKPPNAVEGLIPKLTLKLGPPSPMPPSPDTIRRLNIKPIVKKEEEVHSPPHVSPVIESKLHVENNQSPELAKISALVTRPPKSKSSSKHNTSKSDSNESSLANSPPAHPSNVSPIRKSKTPSYAKYKRLFKPIARRNSSDFDDPIIGLATDELEITEAPPPERIPNVPSGIPNYTEQGSKVWICPACRRPDNGTPMIACDGCDEWYHWVCVGIHVEPENSEDWYCTNCSAKRTAMASAMASGQTGKKRGRKPKVDKLKENR